MKSKHSEMFCDLYFLAAKSLHDVEAKLLVNSRMLRKCISLGAACALALMAQSVHDYVANGTPNAAGPRVTRIKYLIKGFTGRVDWLPNSNLIAYDTPARSEFTDVFVMNGDGSNQHCITCNIAGLTEYKGNPAWHPSGKYILFQATDPALPKTARSQAQYMQVTSPGSGWHNNLWIVAADGSQAWQLTHLNEHQGLIHAHFDYAGSRVLWAQLDRQAGQASWSIKIAPFTVQGGVPQLGAIRSLTPGNLSFYETHCFSPDGSKILFSGKPQGASAAHLNWGIFAFDLQSGTMTTLVDPKDSNWNEHAQYTPDARHIVWMSSMGIPQNKSYEGDSLTSPFATLKTDYWIMDADGSNKQRLTFFNDAGSPMYIPNQVIASDLSFHTNTEMVCNIGDNPGHRHGEIAVINFAN
jgi:Tol biopolymer transport system component